MADGAAGPRKSMEERLQQRLGEASAKGLDVESGAPFPPEQLERAKIEREARQQEATAQAAEAFRRGMQDIRRVDTVRHAADVGVYNPVREQLRFGDDSDDAGLDAAAHLVEEAEARYDAVERAAAVEGEVEQTQFFRVELNRKEVQPAAVQPVRPMSTRPRGQGILPIPKWERAAPSVKRVERPSLTGVGVAAEPQPSASRGEQAIRIVAPPERRESAERAVLEQWRQRLVDEWKIVDTAGTGLAPGYTAEQFGLTEQHLSDILRLQQDVYMEGPSAFERQARQVGLAASAERRPTREEQQRDDERGMLNRHVDYLRKMLQTAQGDEARMLNDDLATTLDRLDALDDDGSAMAM